jgi:hypothetical protein
MEVDIDSYLAQVEREKAASEDPNDGNKDVNQSSPLNANDDVVPIEQMRIIPIYALCTVVLAIGAMLFAEIKIVTYVSSSIAIFISGITLLQGRMIRKSASEFSYLSVNDIIWRFLTFFISPICYSNSTNPTRSSKGSETTSK